MQRQARVNLFQTLPSYQLPRLAKSKRLKRKELSALKEELARKMKSSVISHSKKEALLTLPWRTSTSKKKVKTHTRKRLKRKKLLLNQRLAVVLKERRRLHPNQLLKVKELLERNQLNPPKNQERLLKRFWSTHQADQQERKKHHKKERSQLRDQSPRRPQLSHPQVEKRMSRPPIKWPCSNSRSILTGTNPRKERHQVVKF